MTPAHELPPDHVVARAVARSRAHVMTVVVETSPRMPIRTRNRLWIAAASILVVAIGGLVAALPRPPRVDHARDGEVSCFGGMTLAAPTVQIVVMEDEFPDGLTPAGLCAEPWEAGGLPGGTLDNEPDAHLFEAPPLASCWLPTGVAAAFPAENGATIDQVCGLLGLRVWTLEEARAG